MRKKNTEKEKEGTLNVKKLGRVKKGKKNEKREKGKVQTEDRRKERRKPCKTVKEKDKTYG